jgi:TetR/AcrR family transcriptional regulator, transcriptional repressor for nem operon
MRVSKEQAAKNREHILETASQLLRERGIAGVGVDALAEAAGMTHGSLYSQFGSKERLAEEALRHAFGTSSARMSDARTLDDFVARYLTPEHRERRGDGCVGRPWGARCQATAPRSGAASRTLCGRWSDGSLA